MNLHFARFAAPLVGLALAACSSGPDLLDPVDTPIDPAKDAQPTTLPDAAPIQPDAGGDASDAPLEAGPDAKPPSSKLPNKVLGIYFFMYDTPPLSTIQANAPQYNVMYFAFALGTNNGGNVTFSVPSGGGEAKLKSDIQAWKASGRVALLSIGGGSDTGLRLTNANQGTQFVSSITPILQNYGFQGIDWDLEQGPSQFSPSVVVSVSQQLKQKFGSNFVISIVPRPYEFRSGANPHPYRDVATGLGADLDLIQFQFYDYPESKNANQQMSIISGDVNDAIKNFPANKIVIGGESPNAGLAWSPATVYRDAYVNLNGSTGGLRGAFVWDSPNEQASGWNFAKTLGPSL
jgi:hypothetical protein